MTAAFVPFPKMPRLSREIVVTEKLDGTNAQINIEMHLDRESYEQALKDPFVVGFRLNGSGGQVLRVGSRTRWIRPGDDNFAFALWVSENLEELFKLGPGSHFGEWYGKGVQRNYGLQERRFALFNTHRWSDEAGVRPACCEVVPTLYRGPFCTNAIDHQLKQLGGYGSRAVPGFMNPEGIVIFHTAGNVGFKKTIYKDEVPKALAA